MLKLPKGLKKKKKGKKSKKKEEELFTEEELERYRKEHQQQQAAAGEGSVQENEEWSKFKHLTTGVDSVLRKTQGDLDRIKSTSFFQRVPAGPKQVDSVGQEVQQESSTRAPARPPVQVTAADFPQLTQVQAVAAPEPSDSGSSEDEQDDIFDTSYVEAVERGEVKLAYVPDSPEGANDDFDIFDTSHVDALIKGQEVKVSKGKKALDIGVAVEVLTGRIDNVALPTTKRSKRVIPGDLLLENVDPETPVILKAPSETVEKSILDVNEDIPNSSEPIDLSVSLHTSLIQQNKQTEDHLGEDHKKSNSEDEFDEFTLLATESLEVGTEVVKLEKNEIKAEPVTEESWSAFEADKNNAVFAESIVEDQIDILDPYLEQDDPFDTSFADAVVPVLNNRVSATAITSNSVLDEDDDFDPRAEEVKLKLNNRRKSSVRIHLTDPSGLRESITSDDLNEKEVNKFTRDLLGGSTTDLSLIGDSPIAPLDVDVVDEDYDPFDTTAVDKIVAPGKGELKLLEKELIGESNQTSLYRVPSDPDFDPRAEESTPVREEQQERRASRPENLLVNKSVVFCVEGSGEQVPRVRRPKPVTPYYTRNLSIGEEVEVEGLTRTRSDEDIAPKVQNLPKRRHSEFPKSVVACGATELLESGQSELYAKVLTPIAPQPLFAEQADVDPFDTSFAADIAPGKVELKLLAKEFSCEEQQETSGERDLLDPSDDIFQVKALTPEPTNSSRVPEVQDFDPFDTSFANDLNPGRSELKLLESEFLN